MNLPFHHHGLAPRWQRRIAMNSRRGALLAALALPAACDDDSIALDAGAPPSTGGTSSSVPSAESGSPPPEPDTRPGGIAPLPDVASGGAPESDMLALGVLERLEALCGACHANGDNGAGFSGGLDLHRLIESGLIVPGSSATSPLLARILDGSMPPEAAVGQPPPRRSPTVGDIALLADFIDQLATAPLPVCEPLPFMGLDAVYAALLADVLGRPPEERPYVRYVSLSEGSNARLCGPALDQQRQALFKLVNSLSMQSEIHLPVDIDETGLLYRVDLRDYGWAREIDLDGDGNADFSDGWAAAIEGVPTRVAFTGPEASALSIETGSEFSLSSLGALVRVASNGDVYRALLGVPANVYDMELFLGLDSVAEIEAGNARRAGFLRYPPRSEVIVSRFSLDDASSGYWMFDIDEEIGSNSIFIDPLSSYVGQWTKTLWRLPNGLFGYLVNDASGTPLAELPRGCVGTCVRPEALHPVGCMGCHTGGVLPVRDAIRSYVEANGDAFDRDSTDDTLALYPPAAELDQLIADDNARYGAALARLGIAPGTPDPISRVYLDVDRPLDLERAAAELGVPAQTLAEHLGALPALAPLADPAGTVERSGFDAARLDALCVVHAASRNRPAACP